MKKFYDELNKNGYYLAHIRLPFWGYDNNMWKLEGYVHKDNAVFYKHFETLEDTTSVYKVINKDEPMIIVLSNSTEYVQFTSIWNDVTNNQEFMSRVK